MSSEVWKNISIVFLSVGSLFLIITIVLSIKFQLFSIIKAELQNRKSSGEEEYFAYAENKNKMDNVVEQFSQEDIPFAIPIGTSHVQESVSSATVPTFRNRGDPAQNTLLSENTDSATVLSTSRRNSVPEVSENTGSATVLSTSRRYTDLEVDNSATVVTSRRRNPSSTAVENDAFSPPEESTEDFVIIDNIMVIHGDPSRVQGNNA